MAKQQNRSPSTQVVAELISMGLLNLEYRDNVGLTPLHVAVQSGKYLSVQSMLENGVQVDAKTDGGKTALTIAISKLLPEMVKILLDHEADLNKAYENGQCPEKLVFANRTRSALVSNSSLEQKQQAILNLIFQHGAKSKNIVQANYYKLCKAVMQGDFQATKRVTNSLISVNFPTIMSENPLWYAVYFDQLEIAELLLQRGANPNQDQNLDRKSVLILAIEKRNLEFVELLLRFKADLNFFSFDKNRTPLCEAACLINDFGKEIIRLLLKNGAEVNALSKVHSQYSFDPEKNESALHGACEKRNLEDIKLLIEYGADVKSRNNYGETPLQRALQSYCSMDCIKILLEHGADITMVDNWGWTILHSVAEHSSLEIVKYIIGLALDRGIEINTRDKDGYTAIHDIDCENVTEFLKCGADINILSNDGSSMEHWCSYDEDENGCPALKYVNKLHYLGFKIKDKKMWSILKNDALRTLCHQELEKLQSKIICWNPKTRLYDVLFMGRSSLNKYIENTHLKEAFAECGDDFEYVYPCYGSILNLQYHRGTRRRNFMVSARCNLYKVLGTEILEEQINMIFKYLKDSKLWEFANETFE